MTDWLAITWSQPEVVTSVPWTPRIPASSNCVTYQSADLFPASALGYQSSSTLTASSTYGVASAGASSGAAAGSGSSGNAAAATTTGGKAASASGSSGSAASSAMGAALPSMGLCALLALSVSAFMA